MGAERKKRVAGKRKKRSAKQVATGLAIAQRRVKATKLKLAGWSVRDIAAHLKVSVGTAQSDIAAAYAEAEDQSAAYVKRERAISLERLDVATKGIWPSVENGDLEAVDRLVKIETRRARAVGFDAADKVEHSGPDGAPIALDARTSLLERLAGLVAGENAGAAAQGGSGEAEPTGG